MKTSEKRTCVICGSEFTPRNNQQICCCKECSKKNKKQYYKRQLTGPSGGYVECIECGKRFYSERPSIAKYCSKKCCNIARYRRVKDGTLELKHDQPCWKCARTCTAMCPWIAFGRPVPGWEAEATPETVSDNGKIVKPASYKITSCPMFVADERRKGRAGNG